MKSDDDLGQAIEDLIQEYDRPDGMVTDWALAYRTVATDDDGELEERVDFLTSHDSFTSNIIAILELAKLTVYNDRADI